MKKFFKIYHNSDMIRPTVNQTFIRIILVLLISLLWERFLDQGSNGIGFILSVLGFVLILLAWFSYLSLDGVHVTPEKRSSTDRTRSKKHVQKDMIDYTGEEVNPLEDLTRDEKAACHLLSSLISGVLFLAVGTVMSVV